MKNSQTTKILCETMYAILNTQALVLVASNKLNRWEIKNDRKIFLKNGVELHKANSYRAEKMLGSIPFFKPLEKSTYGPLFFGYSPELKNFTELLQLFLLKTDHTKTMFVLQNNVLFSKKRLEMANKEIMTREKYAWPLIVPSNFFLLISFHELISNLSKKNL